MSTEEGIIVKGIGGFYYVDTGEKIIECRARGKFRKTDITPMVGDRVSVSGDGGASLCKIFPRKNFLVRPPVANIDSIVIVCAAKNPAPDFSLTDKMLVIAESRNIEGTVCINKTDLVSQKEVNAMADIYKKAGYGVIVACAATGEGAEELSAQIKGKTVAFAGLSGVGKSSLLSLVTGRELAVGDVSKILRGKHTTRHVELISACGGYVFDTPGFSRLEIEGVKAAELRFLFPEIAKHEGECRFRGCAHILEPDCAVLKAVENGEIASQRHKSYTEFYEILKNIKEWEQK